MNPNTLVKSQQTEEAPAILKQLTKQANQLILHVVYPFIQIGRTSTTDHWGLASHQHNQNI